MEIEAVWPRQTYATEPYIPVSVCLIPPVDAKPSWGIIYCFYISCCLLLFLIILLVCF